VMTFMFDPAKGMEALHGLERQWGGTAQQRLTAKYNAYAAQAGEQTRPPPQRDADIFNQVDAEARIAAEQPVTGATDAAINRSVNVESDAPVPAQAPALSPSPPPAAGPEE
jgi:penicillin-binding protein 2